MELKIDNGNYFFSIEQPEYEIKIGIKGEEVVKVDWSGLYQKAYKNGCIGLINPKQYALTFLKKAVKFLEEGLSK